MDIAINVDNVLVVAKIVPEEWLCAPEYYNSADGCDCECELGVRLGIPIWIGSVLNYVGLTGGQNIHNENNLI